MKNAKSLQNGLLSTCYALIATDQNKNERKDFQSRLSTNFFILDRVVEL